MGKVRLWDAEALTHRTKGRDTKLPVKTKIRDAGRLHNHAVQRQNKPSHADFSPYVLESFVKPKQTWPSPPCPFRFGLCYARAGFHPVPD